MAVEEITEGTVKGKAINELQRLTPAVVAGAAADTDIPVTGITTEDTLQSVIEFASGVPTDRTATTSITSDGNIQCSVDTASDVLVVQYWRKPTRT